jgi:alkanesulfonate monooxygenase SsuD/methylene tetrahydromethanopterin reductase-like flavin-dependent oxidoreductase (luciferase family)
MKLSYFMMPIHDPQKDYHLALEEDTAAIIHADKLGYSEVWVGEHYSSTVEQITSPMMFMSNLIARTEQIKFATGVICMSQYHPALVAGQAALFDHLSKGRFIMGIGPGGLPPDFELFGVTEFDRGEMMVEAIDMILKIWESDPPYDIKGKYWNTKIQDWVIDEIGLGHMAKPYQQPHPPIALSAMSPYSGMMRLAAVRGWIPISANFVGNWSVKSQWDAHIDECEKQHKEPDPEIWHVARSIYVADTDAEAEKFARQPGGTFDYYYKYLFTIFDRADMKKAFVTTRDMDPAQLTHESLRDDLVIYGSPQTVAEKILQFREEVGHFGTLVMTAHDWIDKEKMKRSMELMATEVMPAVNREIGAA